MTGKPIEPPVPAADRTKLSANESDLDREIWALRCLYHGIDPALPEVAPVPRASMH